MCGIAGLQLAPGRYADTQQLSSFQASLRHRGPDASGAFVSSDRGTALVSTRLAIVDLQNGNQPLTSRSGLVLVVNGEIYNAPELRAQFKTYPFVTGSDSEVVFPLFETYGLDFCRHLRGMFAIALYDEANNQLTLSRDPFGIKPLYYIESQGRFAFASEIGALLDADCAVRDTDPTARAELLQLRHVAGHKTIIPSICRIAPGQTLVIEGGAVQRAAPWTSRRRTLRRQNMAERYCGIVSASPSALLEKFDAIIRDSVQVHLRGDVPACLFFSGGIDSTILMKVAREVSPSPIEALTVGYAGHHRGDESWDALALAREAGTLCERIEMSGNDFFALAPRIAAAVDDPMSDPAVLPLYMLAKAAHDRGFKVALSGEGADELFGGYRRYRRATLPHILAAPKSRRGVFSGGKGEAALPDWAREIEACALATERNAITPLQTLLEIDMQERLRNWLLTKTDRALMAHGVEGRTPYLDRRVAVFARNLPDGLRANPRFGKRILRDWLAAHFPQARPFAKKKGFNAPIAAWIGAHQSELAALVSKQHCIVEVFAPSRVQEVFAQVERDAQPAWSLLFYALWHAHYIGKVDASGNIAAVLETSACR